MLRLEDSRSWLRQAKEVAEEMDRRQVALRLPVGRARAVAALLQAAPESSLVHVPAGPDQVERIVLALGRALGAAPAASVAMALRAPEASGLDHVLEVLTGSLGATRLVVDGWDDLGAGWEVDALRDRTLALRDWLSRYGRLFVVTTRCPQVAALRTAAGPTLGLANGAAVDVGGLWEALGEDSEAHSAALTALALGAQLQDLEGLSKQRLRDRVMELMPLRLRRALEVLAVHGRPIEPQRLFSFSEGQTADQDAVMDRGHGLGLWSRLGPQVLPDLAWTDFVVSRMPLERRRQVHRELAQAFTSVVASDDVGKTTVGLHFVEAHRHFVGAGDLEAARAWVRFGAGPLLEAARASSISGRYSEAARLYEWIVDAAERGEMPAPKRLRAYARHYLHYNRAHGGMEPLSSTARGYRASLGAWPENALFWSRLVRTMVIDGHLEAALDELGQAQRAVPSHPQKQTLLIARTVRGLLERRKVFEALVIWSSYEADTDEAEEVAGSLEAALDQGWSTQRLVSVSAADVVLTYPAQVRIHRSGAGWSARIDALAAYGEDTSALAALTRLIEGLRTEARRLIAAYSSDLNPTERLRKRVLLGAVDVCASRLDAAAAETYWVMGTLHSTDGWWLRAGGSRDAWFEVPAELVEGDPDREAVFLATVKVSVEGVPTGPVTHLEPADVDAEADLWAAWRRVAIRE